MKQTLVVTCIFSVRKDPGHPDSIISTPNSPALKKYDDAANDSKW